MRLSVIGKSWAISHADLPEGVQRTLFALGDLHSEKNGCYPSQMLLSKRAKRSPSSINTDLLMLEGLGLVTRNRRLKPGTHKSATTMYDLHFDRRIDARAVAAYKAKPNASKGQRSAKILSAKLESSRVALYDKVVLLGSDVSVAIPTELCRPVDYVLAKCGPGLSQIERIAIRRTDSVIDELIARGCHLEVIVAAIAAKTSKARNPCLAMITTWRYFEKAIEELAEKIGIMLAEKPASSHVPAPKSYATPMRQKVLRNRAEATSAETYTRQSASAVELLPKDHPERAWLTASRQNPLADQARRDQAAELMQFGISASPPEPQVGLSLPALPQPYCQRAEVQRSARWLPRTSRPR